MNEWYWLMIELNMNNGIEWMNEYEMKWLWMRMNIESISKWNWNNVWNDILLKLNMFWMKYYWNEVKNELWIRKCLFNEIIWFDSSNHFNVFWFDSIESNC